MNSSCVSFSYICFILFFHSLMALTSLSAPTHQPTFLYTGLFLNLIMYLVEYICRPKANKNLLQFKAVGANPSAWPDDISLFTFPHDSCTLTYGTLVCFENICFMEWLCCSPECHNTVFIDWIFNILIHSPTSPKLPFSSSLVSYIVFSYVIII